MPDASHLMWAAIVTTFTVLLFIAYTSIGPDPRRRVNALVIVAGVLGIFCMAYAATAAQP